ncbi:MAG: hypothetical protein ABSD43_02555 [Terracidiphilus sp.]
MKAFIPGLDFLFQSDMDSHSRARPPAKLLEFPGLTHSTAADGIPFDGRAEGASFGRETDLWPFFCAKQDIFRKNGRVNRHSLAPSGRPTLNEAFAAQAEMRPVQEKGKQRLSKVDA